MVPGQIAFLLKMVDLLATGIKLAPQLKQRYDAASEQLQQMIQENRAPTPEEWDELNSRIEDLQSRLGS